MKTLQELFTKETGPIPYGMSERVFARIERAALVAERTKTYITWSFFIVSLSAFIGSCVYASQAFAHSNFGSYFSLIFSDLGTLGIVWKDLGLSLVESLPIVGIMIFLGSMGALLWSIRKLSRTTFITNSGASLA